MQLVSCREFTVQGEIPKELFKKFGENLENFQMAVLAEMRSIVGKKVSGDVVDIRYAFNNSGIMDLLEKRAGALRKADLKQVHAIE